jgi:hypothetical protein
MSGFRLVYVGSTWYTVSVTYKAVWLQTFAECPGGSRVVVSVFDRPIIYTRQFGFRHLRSVPGVVVS